MRMFGLCCIGMRRTPRASIYPARLLCDLGDKAGHRQLNIQLDDVSQRMEQRIKKTILHIHYCDDKDVHRQRNKDDGSIELEERSVFRYTC